MASKGIKATYRNGYAEGGLLADSSRTWKMESDYPEYQKGIANRLSKESVPSEEIDAQFMYSPLKTGYAEGGEVDNFMDETGSMLAPEAELNFEDEMPMGDEIPMEGEEEILDGLSTEDQEVLFQAMSDYPELEGILNTLSANDSSESFDADVFNTEGSVEGAGTGTSDSIPANLSDGEFVFTAKAVQHIGVDKLRKQMAKAEMDADEGDAKQKYAQMGDMGFAAGGLLTRDNFAKGGVSDSDYPLGVTDKEGYDKMINAHYDEWSPSDGIPGEGNPHIGEKAIMRNPRMEEALPTPSSGSPIGKMEGEGDLGTRLMEELGLDDKGFKGFKKGMPQIGRARDEWQTG